MPNHVTNNIYLKGDSDRIRELLEAIKNDEYGTGSIDFNKIIPMPESLDITSGSETVRCHKIYKDFLDVYTLMDTREGLDLMSIPIEAEERYLEERTDVAKEDFELGKQVFRNMQLYGAPTWYEYIVDFANKCGFHTYVKERLHNMIQSSKPGEMFEELLIANYDLEKQAEINNKYLTEINRQLNLFDFQHNY